MTASDETTPASRAAQGTDPGEKAAAPAGGSLGGTAAAVAVGTLVVGGLFLLWQARDLVFVTVLGLLFGVGLAAPIDLLTARRMPRPAATLLTVATLGGVLWLAGWWLGPRLAEQGREIERHLPQAVERVVARFDAEAARVGSRDELEERARTELLESSGEIARRLFRFLSTLAGLISALVLVVVIAIWYAAQPDTYRRALVRLAPLWRRDAAGRTVEAVETTWRRWLVGQTVSMLVIGVLTSVVLSLLGVQAPLALGVIAGVAEFIPVFGPLLSAVPALLLAFLDGPRMALWVLVAYVGIQQLESNVVMPLVMRQAVRVPPLLTILAGSLFVLFGGFLGLLVAVPVVAAVLAAVRVARGEDLFA